MTLDHAHVECAQTGCFAVITLHPQEEARLRSTHEVFYCPAGHQNFYPGKTTQEKEIERLEQIAIRLRRDVKGWIDRDWESQKVRGLLARGLLTCPLGCGWKSSRRLLWRADRADARRFMDRAGSDLVEHLAAAHGAKVRRELTERAGS